MSDDHNEENFAELFEQSLTEKQSFAPGQLVETEIVAISGETIFLQLNGKSEGVLDKAELTDEEGNLTVKEGDVIKTFFLAAKNGELRFTTKVSGEKAGSAILENAYQTGIPVEGSVAKEIKGGFEVRLGGIRAFCPFSQMNRRRIENAEEWVGKTLSFKIMEYKEGGRNILVSHRAILEEERQEQLSELKEKLQEGMIVKGTIKELRDFGAFVDLDGFQALLPVSEIKRTRVEKIQDELTVGQEVEAKILSIDWKRERISLSTKALLADPWDDAADRYPEGSKLNGKVVRMTSFGAFIELEPGIDGLLHISAIEGDSELSGPGKQVKKGQILEVMIHSVDTEKKRISLKTGAAAQEMEAARQYTDNGSDSETYNPFAILLKDKNKKKK